MGMSAAHRRAVVVAVSVVCAITAALAAGVVAAGDGFALPTDDGYARLAAAGAVAELGAVHPSEVSSPGWIAALALMHLLRGHGDAAGAAALSLVGACGALAIGGRTLARAGVGSAATLLTLLAVTVASPLPILAAHGLEHTAHLAFALALVAALDAPPSRAAAWRVGAFAFAAACLRGESLSLILGIVLLERARSARAAAALAGGALALVAAGLLGSESPGVPALVAGALRSDAGRNLLAAVNRAAPLLVLTSVVAASRGPGRARALFVVSVAAQVTLGRVDPVGAADAWLYAWGVLLLGLSGRVAPIALLVVTATLALRSTESFARVVPSARFVSRALVAPAALLAERAPGARVAAESPGALRFVGGVQVVAPNDADIGWGSPEWAAGREERGRVDVRFDDAVSQTFVLRSTPAYAEPLRRALVDARARWHRGVRVQVADEVPIDLSEAERVGAAVAVEDGGAAFYTNGELSTRAPASGALWIEAEGSLADGRLPRFTIVIQGVERATLDASARGDGARAQRVTDVWEGQDVRIRYDDDAVDASGADRNLWVPRMWIEVVAPGPGGGYPP